MKGEYPERPVVSVGAIIIQDNCALLVRCGTNPGKGFWSVPGGKVELGETLPQAVAREAHEETGLLIEPGKVLNVSDAIFRDEHRRISSTTCSWISGAAQAKLMKRAEFEQNVGAKNICLNVAAAH